MKSKSLICFDLDGTLIDNSLAHAKAYNYAFKKNHLRTFDEEFIIKSLGPGKRKLIRILQPRISEKKFEAVMKDHTEFILTHPELMKPFPGVIGALRKLRTKFRIGLISNNIHENILEILEGCKFSIKFFDVIIGEDDVKHPKPYPDEIFKAEQLLHTNAEYMVGDTTFDIRAGKRANCKTIAVLTGVHDFKKLWAAKPTIIARSVADLPDILLE